MKMNNIGKHIKELRKKFHLTQVELSERAGVGLRFIRELENGKATVQLDKVDQVLRFFGYHIDITKDENKL
ncbi:MAG: helix-turn-helix transcriptional regulator [Candidatus Omnitrophota bacterium]|nr:helix-turn-helix transcriptional regulator [bacterium]MBU4122339.1 helix-turn-helix transcriptional regulator [bacterium]